MGGKISLGELAREVSPCEGRVQAAFHSMLPELSRRYAELFHRVAREKERREQIREVLRLETTARKELTEREREELLQRLEAHMLGLGALDGPYQDPLVSEIQLNPDGQVFVVREGRQYPAAHFFPELAAGLKAEESFRFFQSFFGDIDRPISPEEPLMDGWLPDDSRINAVFSPAVRGGPAITIRKSPRLKEAPTIRSMIRDGCISRPMVALLACAVRGHLNLMIVGPPGAGKTTLMSVLLAFVPASERVVTAQDVLELQVPHRLKNHVELVTVEQGGEERVSIDRLVKAMLRMTPGRGVLVEVRGRETVDYINLCSVGTRGNITSIHGYNAEDARRRVYMEFQKAGVGISREDCHDLFQQATDLVIVCLRTPDGRYRIARVTEMLPDGGLQELFVYDPAEEIHRLVHALSVEKQEYMHLWWRVELPRYLRDPDTLPEWEHRWAERRRRNEDERRDVGDISRLGDFGGMGGRGSISQPIPRPMARNILGPHLSRHRRRRRGGGVRRASV